MFAALLHHSCSQVPVPLLHLPLCHPSPCSAWLCLSEVYCVGCGENSPTLQRAGGRFQTTFDFSVTGCALRYLTVELPTQRPVWAALSPDTMDHGKGGGERGRRGGGFTAEITMYCAVFCPMGGLLKAHCASVVCSATRYCAEHEHYVIRFPFILFSYYLCGCSVAVKIVYVWIYIRIYMIIIIFESVCAEFSH